MAENGENRFPSRRNRWDYDWGDEPEPDPEPRAVNAANGAVLVGFADKDMSMFLFDQFKTGLEELGQPTDGVTGQSVRLAIAELFTGASEISAESIAYRVFSIRDTEPGSEDLEDVRRYLESLRRAGALSYGDRKTYRQRDLLRLDLTPPVAEIVTPDEPAELQPDVPVAVQGGPPQWDEIPDDPELIPRKRRRRPQGYDAWESEQRWFSSK